MTINQIVKLADTIYNIQDEGMPWLVATQSHPGIFSIPTKDLQWYIDANWLIQVNGETYDPRQK